MLQQPGECTHQLQEETPSCCNVSPAPSPDKASFTSCQLTKEKHSESMSIFTEQAIEGEFGLDPIASNRGKFE